MVKYSVCVVDLEYIMDQVQILVMENDQWVKILFPEYK